MRSDPNFPFAWSQKSTTFLARNPLASLLICIILHWLLWLPECAASHCDLFSTDVALTFPTGCSSPSLASHSFPSCYRSVSMSFSGPAAAVELAERAKGSTSVRQFLEDRYQEDRRPGWVRWFSMWGWIKIHQNEAGASRTDPASQTFFHEGDDADSLIMHNYIYIYFKGSTSPTLWNNYYITIFGGVNIQLYQLF